MYIFGVNFGFLLQYFAKLFALFLRLFLAFTIYSLLASLWTPRQLIGTVKNRYGCSMAKQNKVLVLQTPSKALEKPFLCSCGGYLHLVVARTVLEIIDS